MPFSTDNLRKFNQHAIDKSIFIEYNCFSIIKIGGKMANSSKNKYEKLANNYFLKSDTLKYVGAGVLIASLSCLALRLGIFSIILVLLGTPTGIILFIVGSTSRFNDDDIEAQLQSKLLGQQIDIDNEKRFHLKLLKHQKDITLEGYRYSDDMMYKKLKSGVIRSSVFTRTKLRILSDRLYIVSRDVPLLTDEVTETVYEITYDNIKNISILRDEKKIVFNNTTFFIKPCYFSIVTENEELLFPIIDAVTSDDLIFNINRQIKNHFDGTDIVDLKYPQ